MKDLHVGKLFVITDDFSFYSIAKRSITIPSGTVLLCLQSEQYISDNEWYSTHRFTMHSASTGVVTFECNDWPFRCIFNSLDEEKK